MLEYILLIITEGYEINFSREPLYLKIILKKETFESVRYLRLSSAKDANTIDTIQEMKDSSNKQLINQKLTTT